MPSTIQKASIENLEKLYKIEKKCFQEDTFTEEQIAFLVTDRNCVCLVSKVEGEIVGFIIARINPGKKPTEGHILTLDVSPAHRRKGLAVKLLERIEELLQNRGVEVCRLEVREDNTAALNLYRKVGYRKVTALQNYYGNHDGILLEKALC